MSQGPVKPYLDFAQGTDSGTSDASSILPIANGENVVGTVLTRPSEILRERSETVRGVFDDTLYLRDADRGLLLAGPGTVSWPDPGMGATPNTFTLSDSLWIVPSLTPGAAGNTPPVASTYGTLVLRSAANTDGVGILVTANRHNYADGNKINITVVADTVFSVVMVDRPTNTIVVHATGSTTLTTVITALTNLILPEMPALVGAATVGGASGTDVILAPQGPIHIAGNADGEAHLISSMNLATFFSNTGNQLLEGDSLCIEYEMIIDPVSLTKGGRRQSIPENFNTTIPAGSFFNSRVHPEKLVNALPICKVLNSRLVFFTGQQVPFSSVDFDLGTVGAAPPAPAFTGGNNWLDSPSPTTNPATTVDLQLQKMINDLIAKDTPGHGGADKIGAGAVTDLIKGTVSAQLAALAANWFKLARGGQNITGANNWLETQNLFGSGIDNALLFTGTVPAVPVAGAYTPYAGPRQLQWEIPVSSLGTRARFYVTDQGFVLTVNALYRSDGKWVRDGGDGASRDSMRLRLTDTYATIIESYPHTFSNGWDNTAWNILGQFDSTGFTTAAVKIGSLGNPAVTYTPPRNTLFTSSLIKAWAYVDFDNAGGVTLTEGFNINSISIVTLGGSPVLVDVVMQQFMQDGNYAVFGTDMGPTALIHSPYVGTTWATYEKLGTPFNEFHGVMLKQDGTKFVFGTDGPKSISIMVLGKQSL